MSVSKERRASLSVLQIETSQQDVNLGRDLSEALQYINARRDLTHSIETKVKFTNRKESLLAVRLSQRYGLDDCSSLSSYSSSLEGAAIQTAQILNYTNEVQAQGSLPKPFSPVHKDRAEITNYRELKIGLLNSIPTQGAPLLKRLARPISSDTSSEENVDNLREPDIVRNRQPNEVSSKLFTAMSSIAFERDLPTKRQEIQKMDAYKQSERCRFEWRRGGPETRFTTIDACVESSLRKRTEKEKAKSKRQVC